jgi:hypothetical protein
MIFGRARFCSSRHVLTQKPSPLRVMKAAIVAITAPRDGSGGGEVIDSEIRFTAQRGFQGPHSLTRSGEGYKPCSRGAIRATLMRPSPYSHLPSPFRFLHRPNHGGAPSAVQKSSLMRGLSVPTSCHRTTGRDRVVQKDRFYESGLGAIIIGRQLRRGARRRCGGRTRGYLRAIRLSNNSGLWRRFHISKTAVEFHNDFWPVSAARL